MSQQQRPNRFARGGQITNRNSQSPGSQNRGSPSRVQYGQGPAGVNEQPRSVGTPRTLSQARIDTAAATIQANSNAGRSTFCCGPCTPLLRGALGGCLKASDWVDDKANLPSGFCCGCCMTTSCIVIVCLGVWGGLLGSGTVDFNRNSSSSGPSNSTTGAGPSSTGPSSSANYTQAAGRYMQKRW